MSKMWTQRINRTAVMLLLDLVRTTSLPVLFPCNRLETVEVGHKIFVLFYVILRNKK